MHLKTPCNSIIAESPPLLVFLTNKQEESPKWDTPRGRSIFFNFNHLFMKTILISKINVVSIRSMFIAFVSVPFFTLTTFAQGRIVFLENYNSITDLDSEVQNWKYSTYFLKGDTATYMSKSKKEPNYYRVKSKSGVVSFVFTGTFRDLDGAMDKEQQAELQKSYTKRDSLVRIQDAQIVVTLKQREAEARTAEAKRLAIAKAAEEGRDKKIIAEYGQETLDILKRNDGLYIGMPRDLLILWHSYPERINETVNVYGKKEQFVYKNMYCYIENGKLTSWQRTQ